MAKGRNNKVYKKEHEVIQVLLELHVEIPNVLRVSAESHTDRLKCKMSASLAWPKFVAFNEMIMKIPQ